MFSIIVPVYNSEKYIERCVYSLVHQDVDIQVILIENGSTDNALDICKELCSRFSNVELYENNNKGVSFARNTGLKHANGEIIGFCDADDYYVENCLGMVQDAFEKTSADIIITALKTHYGKTVIEHRSRREKLIDRTKAIDEIMCNPIIFGSVCNKFYRKDLIQYMCFPEDITHLEDGYMNIQLLTGAQDFKVYVSRIITYNYVSNPLSATMVFDRCFDENGALKYSVAIYKMLSNLHLNKKEQNSVKDALFKVSVESFYGFRKNLSHQMKLLLYKDIVDNYRIYLKRIFRYNLRVRLIYLVKGIMIVLKVIE